MSGSKQKKVYKRRERSWRGKLVEKFPYAKFLKLMLYNAWFAFFTMLIAAIILAVGIVIPKFFPVTPVHMAEVEKRSILDFMQASQLRKTAQRHADQGDIDEAINAWVQSVQQNPGKTETVREFVSYLVENDNSSQRIGQAVNFGQWLLQLAKTNSTDAILVSKVYIKYGFPSETLKLLEPIHESLDDSVRMEYVKALFENQELEQFLAEYQKLPPALKENATVKPLYLAYEFGFSGNPLASQKASQELLAMSDADPANDFLLRLIFLVAAKRQDTDLLAVLLKKLSAINADRPQHHHDYWLILSKKGDADLARKFARDYPNPPFTARGLVSQYETLLELGLNNEADDFASKHIERFGYVPQPWFSICNSLVERAEWQKLNRIADKMILDSRMVKYISYAYYFKGKAFSGELRLASAADEFNKITALGLASDESALDIIRELTILGYPSISKKLLEGLIDLPVWTDRKDFWISLWRAGWNTRDLQTALKATTRLFQLDPTDQISAFNYTACLIAERSRLSEALVRSQDILSLQPNFIPALINYSLALLLNDRLDEAETILRIQINPDSIAPELQPSYNLALFELAFKREKLEEAAQIYSQIKRDELYQEQQRWLLNAFASIQTRLN